MGVGYLSCVGYRETLDALVVAFCRDYFERERVIGEGACSRRTRMEYEYVNGRILDAAREIVGSDGEIYIREIGEKCGYANSVIVSVSEPKYKQTKKEVKLNIAKKLHLID